MSTEYACRTCRTFRHGHHRADCPDRVYPQQMDERFGCPEPHCATVLTRADFTALAGKSPEAYYAQRLRPATALLPIPGPDDTFTDTGEGDGYTDHRSPR